MQKINISSLPAQTFTTTLDSQHCTISLYQRGRYLYLDLWANGTPICKGAICQNGGNIVQSRHHHFSGRLHFFDQLGSSSPQWDGIGERYLLIFSSEGETLPDRLRH